MMKIIASLLLVLSVAGMAAIVAVPRLVPYRTAAAVSVGGIEYDSAKTPVYQRTETEQGPLRDFSMSMTLKPYSTVGYTDLFQTAPLNRGLRIEINGRTIAVMVGADRASGVWPFIASTSYDGSKPFTIAIHIDPKKRFQIWVNGVKGGDLIQPDLDYEISNIQVGSGYNDAFKFKGKLTDVSYSYKIYKPIEYPAYLSVLLGILFVGSVVWLVVLSKNGPAKRLS